MSDTSFNEICSLSKEAPGVQSSTITIFSMLSFWALGFPNQVLGNGI